MKISCLISFLLTASFVFYCRSTETQIHPLPTVVDIKLAANESLGPNEIANSKKLLSQITSAPCFSLRGRITATRNFSCTSFPTCSNDTSSCQQNITSGLVAQIWHGNGGQQYFNYALRYLVLLLNQISIACPEDASTVGDDITSQILTWLQSVSPEYRTQFEFIWKSIFSVKYIVREDEHDHDENESTHHGSSDADEKTHSEAETTAADKMKSDECINLESIYTRLEEGSKSAEARQMDLNTIATSVLYYIFKDYQLCNFQNFYQEKFGDTLKAVTKNEFPLNEEGFEQLIEKLKLSGVDSHDDSHGGEEEHNEGDDHDGHDHKKRRRRRSLHTTFRIRRSAPTSVDPETDDHDEDSKCLGAEGLLETHGYSHESSIGFDDIKVMCPAMLDQQLSGVCQPDPPASATKGPLQWQVYLYGSISITLISVTSLSGLVLVTCMNTSTYQYVLTLFIALAVSTLLGDSLIHLIPEALGVHKHEAGHDHESGPLIEGFIWKQLVVCAALYLFYLFELFMTWIHQKTGLAHGHSHGHSHVPQIPSQNHNDANKNTSHRRPRSSPFRANKTDVVVLKKAKMIDDEYSPTAAAEVTTDHQRVGHLLDCRHSHYLPCGSRSDQNQLRRLTSSKSLGTDRRQHGSTSLETPGCTDIKSVESDQHGLAAGERSGDVVSDGDGGAEHGNGHGQETSGQINTLINPKSPDQLDEPTEGMNGIIAGGDSESVHVGSHCEPASIVINPNPNPNPNQSPVVAFNNLHRTSSCSKDTQRRCKEQCTRGCVCDIPAAATDDGAVTICTCSHAEVPADGCGSSEGEAEEADSATSHHHHHGDKTQSNDKYFLGVTPLAWMLILGDTLHNLGDGLAVGAAFTASLSSGLQTSVAVFCHELPHEIGDFAVLLSTGLSIKKVLLFNFMSALSAFIGLFIGISLASQDEAKFWILAGVAGMFLYVALVDMLPEMVHMNKLSLPTVLMQNIGFILGLTIIVLISLVERIEITL